MRFESAKVAEKQVAVPCREVVRWASDVVVDIYFYTVTSRGSGSSRSQSHNSSLGSSTEEKMFAYEFVKEQGVCIVSL